jgi:hypothetical protein
MNQVHQISSASNDSGEDESDDDSDYDPDADDNVESDDIDMDEFYETVQDDEDDESVESAGEQSTGVQNIGVQNTDEQDELILSSQEQLEQEMDARYGPRNASYG